MKLYSEALKIEHFEPAEGRRILVVSDIHGNLSYFRGVLKKAGFCSSDCLIIDGDFLEKGDESLNTLRYVMELCRNNGAKAVLGNCDSWHLMFGMSPEMDAFMQKTYFRRFKGGILREMFAECGLGAPESCSDFSAAKAVLSERYREEWAFLKGLPHAIETENFVFCHSGYNPSLPLNENSPEDFLHTDALLDKDYYFDKWCIVGHWPVMLYGEDIVCANPVIDREKMVVSIDGACVLKDDGQLNCLIIPNGSSDDFSWVSYDCFPEKTVVSAQKAGLRSYYIRWGDSRVQVLRRGEEFSFCRHIRTGYEMEILTKYLFSGEDITDCNDCTDYILPLEPGDRVSVVETTSKGYFVKHNGVSGWYYGELK